MRLGLALGGIALVAVVGGCTSQAPSGPVPSGPVPSGPVPSGSAPPFTEPPAYGYVLSRGCDGASPLGRYRVTVRDRAVTASERLGAAVQAPPSATDADLGPVAGQDGEEIEAPTLGELLEIAQTAADDGGEVTATYDTEDGHPVEVVVNVSGQPSGAECFAVSEYVPVS